MDGRRNNLYINEEILLTGCTGFQVLDGFLIATTLKHTIRFLPLDTFASELKIDDIQLTVKTEGANNSFGASNFYDEMVRTVETGSKIVLAVPGAVSLILQVSIIYYFFTPASLSQYSSPYFQLNAAY